MLLLSRGRACTETEKNERGREEGNRHNHRMCSAKYYNLTRIDCDLNNVFAATSRQWGCWKKTRKERKRTRPLDEKCHLMFTESVDSAWRNETDDSAATRQCSPSKRLYAKCAACSRLSQKNAAARCCFSITRRDIFLLSFFLSLSLPLSHSRLRAQYKLIRKSRLRARLGLTSIRSERSKHGLFTLMADGLPVSTITWAVEFCELLFLLE